MKFNDLKEASEVAQKYLATADLEPLQSENGKFVFTDGYNGTIFLAWNRDLVVIISGLAKDQSDIADKYTSAILE